MPSIRRASAASGPNIFRLLAIGLAAASLAACAQSQVASRTSSFRQAAVERHHYTRLATTERVSIVRRHDAYSSQKHTGDLKLPPTGVASFYTEGTRTANGEKFDPNQLTAAHPTLPFGTKLRVTNTTNGQSVTVRVNDRGPFVQGRVVDVSYSAAQALGMVGSGTAKVKLDVVQ
jgi:rare lipoprotein A